MTAPRLAVHDVEEIVTEYEYFPAKAESPEFVVTGVKFLDKDGRELARVDAFRYGCEKPKERIGVDETLCAEVTRLAVVGEAAEVGK